MPCPFFEPVSQSVSNARVPLIDQYDGKCRAQGEPMQAPPEKLFPCCNHGYSLGICEFFPEGELRSAMRYSVTAVAETEITLICIEEREHSPTLRAQLRFDLVSKELLGCDDVIIAAQARAFCESYWTRHLRR